MSLKVWLPEQFFQSVFNFGLQNGLFFFDKIHFIFSIFLSPKCVFSASLYFITHQLKILKYFKPILLILLPELFLFFGLLFMTQKESFSSKYFPARVSPKKILFYNIYPELDFIKVGRTA